MGDGVMHIAYELSSLVEMVENATDTKLEPVKPDTIPKRCNDYADAVGMIMVKVQERVAQFVRIIDEPGKQQPYLRFSPKVDKQSIMKAIDTWWDIRSKYFSEYRYSNIVGIYLIRSLQFMMEIRYLWNKGDVEFSLSKSQDTVTNSEIAVA